MFSAPISVRALAIAATLPFLLAEGPAAAQDAVTTIEHAKGSIAALGTFDRTRSPAFQIRGTAFAVADGTLLATAAHAIPGVLDGKRSETLGILAPMPNGGPPQFREAKPVTVDPDSGVALLRIGGAPLPALVVRDSSGVKEGQAVLFTGFVAGAGDGNHPASQRGMVAAIVPMTAPTVRTADLDPKTIRRVTRGPVRVFRLDAIGFAGQTGAPLLDPESGEVLGVIDMAFGSGSGERSPARPLDGIPHAIPSSALQDLLQRTR